MKTTNLIPRIIIAIIVTIPFIFWHDFYTHFKAYLSGNIITHIVTHEWKVVIASIVLFMIFLIPLSFRRKANWMEYGLVGAFFVSLFIEMYGIPLTVLFASKYFMIPGAELPRNVVAFDFLGVGLAMDVAMLYGAILMLIGMVLITIAWITLYKNSKQNPDNFVQTGIYRYSRHPQYLGFILIIFGWFIGWPTILTVIFTPILIYKYVSVCRTEEKEMVKIDPAYQSYVTKTPFMI